MTHNTGLKTAFCHALQRCGLRQKLDSTATFSQTIVRQIKRDKTEEDSAFTGTVPSFRFRSFMINCHET